jgi:hypothetical protein
LPKDFGSFEACGDARVRLEQYGFRKVADVHLRDNAFFIENLEPTIGETERVVYVFALGDKIVRIGSSSKPFRFRVLAWERDVSARLQGRGSSTTQAESDAWRRWFDKYEVGQLYARAGTQVSTPIGVISSFLDEENVLLGRYKPPLNRSHHR